MGTTNLQTTEVKASVTKTFRFDGKDYASRQEAEMALAMKVLETEIPLGIENIIEKASEIVKALRIIKRG